MKSFFEALIEWKSAAAMCFSGSVILCAVIMALSGQSAIPLPMLLSLLIMASGGTFIQYVAFGPRIIKQMRYTLRIIVFAVPFLALISANAYFFEWFPMESGINRLLFVGIFLASFIVMIVGFEIFFQITGKKYDGLLGQYRNRTQDRR